MSATTLTAQLDRARDGRRGGYRFLDRRGRERPLGFDELAEGAARFARALQEAGVGRGDRVALVLPTSPGLLQAFFGCHLAGAVPAPLYPPVRLGRLEEYRDRSVALLQRLQAVVVVSDRRVRRVLGEVVAGANAQCGLLLIETMLQGASPPWSSLHRPTPGELALVQFSSGTTGLPSAVGLTHGQLLANVDAILGALPEAVVERGGVCWLPLYHDMGLVGCVMTALRARRWMTLLDPGHFLAHPVVWLEAISRYGAGISPAPDFAYSRCLDRVTDEAAERLDLSSWGAALDGAEPIAAATLRRFGDRFGRRGLPAEALTPVYGLAEASLGVCFGRLDAPFAVTRFDRDALQRGHVVPALGVQPAVELVSVGRPLAGMEVEIRDACGVGGELGSVGHIWARGPSITSGYVCGRATPLRDGWIDTGDLGFLWGGELHVCGRAKDVIILRGRNHAPQPLERACDSVPGVRTGCAVAVGDVGSDGERLLVFVEQREETEDMAEACRRAILASTGLDPHLVVVLEPGTLPRTSSGKLRRGEALRRWHEGTLLPPKEVTRARLAGAMARSALAYWRSR